VEQKQIYDICASGLVDSVLNGYNGTIFAYGQTGAGKVRLSRRFERVGTHGSFLLCYFRQTHTMEGKPDPPNLRGIIPHSFYHIFESVNAAKNQQFLIRASYLEIYNEEIRDLLSKDPKNSLELKENVDSGVYVKDLTSFVVKNVAGECCLRSDGIVAIYHLSPLCWVGLCVCSYVHVGHTIHPVVCPSLFLSFLHRDRPRDAGRQEEPLHGRHGHEHDLLALALHLHHRRRGGRV
jgi:hypothetical protein